MPMNTPTAARTVWPVRMADTVAAGTVRTARVAAFSANRTAVGRRWARWSKTVDMRLLNEGGRRGRAAKLTGRGPSPCPELVDDPPDGGGWLAQAHDRDREGHAVHLRAAEARRART